MDFNKLKCDDIRKIVHNLNFEIDTINEIIFKLSCDERSSMKKLALSLKNKYEEFKKLEAMNEGFYDFDRQYVLNNNYVIAGCDEVGRGPLAGPIVCASVVLDLNDENKIIKNINDSKKIKSRDLKKRLSDEIMKKAKYFKIIEISNDEIDKLGIGVTNQEGLKRSIEELNVNVDLVLSDGYLVKGLKQKNICVIKGDTKSASIMCASIIAKVYRDELMIKYHEKYPQYDFLNNVGYGTKAHVESIKKFGICEYHRKSFVKNII